VTGAEAPVIVVTGEALIDIVVDRDGGLVGHPGGGPYNVARTIGRLAQPVAYLGRLSTDAFGARLRRELAADGVELDAVVPTDAPTTLALAEIAESGVASYRFYTTATSAPGLTSAVASAVLPSHIGTLYVGTLGLVLEPLATTLEGLVHRMDDATLVALDPNCRPSTIEDPAGYRRRMERLLGRSDVIKVSDDDLAWLHPGTPPVEAARRMLLHDGAVALVTLGGEGALVVTRTDVTSLEAPCVEVVDTIGAGDSFIGAFLAHWRSCGFGRVELRRHRDVVAAARFATRVAAMTCTRAGADPPRVRDIVTGINPSP
jgi:fructokinase